MKKKFAVASLTMLLTFGVSISCFAAGSIAHGDISVYKGGELADKLSGQNPVDEGSLMVCDGKCMVKSQGISLVAADKARFAIQNEESVFNLYVRSGKVNYVINDNSRKIAFHTPDGTYTVADVVFNASSSAVVKGFVQVSDAGETEIEVTEGRLVFATGNGMKTVDANNKIVLAVAPGAGAGAGAGAGFGGTTMAIVGGGLVATAAVVAVVANNNSGDTTGAVETSLPSSPSVSSPGVASPSS